MALAAVQPLVQAGTTPAYAAPAAFENISPAPRLFLHVKNTNASPTTVTIADPTLTPAGSAATNPTSVVPATTGDKMIPLSDQFTSPVGNFIVVQFSNVAAGVVAALLQLPAR